MSTVCPEGCWWPKSVEDGCEGGLRQRRIDGGDCAKDRAKCAKDRKELRALAGTYVTV